MITAKEMQPGDVIEFLSDQQTDKGPCSGRCVRNADGLVILQFSDTRETWPVECLEVSCCHNRPKFGNSYWALV